jgi:HEAT repeat protein
MAQQIPDTNSVQACNNALAEFQKALKALTFYPENHPLREEILRKAFQVIANQSRGNGLSLIVRRNGVSFADRDIVVENTPMNFALAKELFAREVQQLTLLPDLSFEEFSDFLSIVALEPYVIIAQGGVADMLAAKGIRSVIANEIDITTVFTRKMAGAPSEDSASEGDSPGEKAEGPAQEFEQPEFCDDDQLSDLSMEELIALMDAEPDDVRYRLISRLLPGKGELLKEGGEFDRLFINLLQLLKHNTDERKSAVKRECALWLFQQLASGEMAEHLLDHLQEEGFGQKETALITLGRLGADVVHKVISRILSTEDQHVVKTLTALLVRIGPTALPPLVGMLRDNNWQIVRTAVVILGEMGNRDAVSDLLQSASHPEGRVRMEAIRSLARIGGREATALLIDLLDDKNLAVRKQAVLWLGITRNERAMQHLMQLANRQDLTGKLHALKKEALVAIGRIGDRQALEPLCRLVAKRHLLANGRWEELKIIAVEAISQLGGESSGEFLEKMKARGGSVGKACAAALKTRERLAKPNRSDDLEVAGEMESRA